MGLFEKLFPRPAPQKQDRGFWQTLTAYQPVFTSRNGSIYESELIRSAIHARATHFSKLRVIIQGNANNTLKNRLMDGPNEWQSWPQFLYRISTILDVQNNAFIVPVFDQYGEVSGIYPILPSRAELVNYGGEPFLRYSFSNGQTAAVELRHCGVLNKFQFRDDFFGENNGALVPTMDLIDLQKQAIEEGVKSSATHRFLAKLTNFAKPEDINAIRTRFNKDNFSVGEGGGVLLFPNTFTDIQQIQGKQFVIDTEQLKLIQTNVYSYFGVNEKVLENQVYGDEFSAFYEGAIEPLAIMLSDCLTRMLFSLRERTFGNAVVCSANRLQYMANKDKFEMTAGLLDRGMLSLNEAREIWNLDRIPDGDRYIMRGEYYDTSDKLKEGGNNDDGTEGNQDI